MAAVRAGAFRRPPERGGRLEHRASGGEQQRIGLARAYLSRPISCSDDEPTSNFDEATGRALYSRCSQLTPNDVVSCRPHRRPCESRPYHRDDERNGRARLRAPRRRNAVNEPSKMNYYTSGWPLILGCAPATCTYRRTGKSAWHQEKKHLLSAPDAPHVEPLPRERLQQRGARHHGFGEESGYDSVAIANPKLSHSTRLRSAILYARRPACPSSTACRCSSVRIHGARKRRLWRDDRLQMLNRHDRQAPRRLVLFL